MVEDGEGLVVQELTPEAAFELLAHEMRFRTLTTLNEADGWLSFGELRERVGVADPGQFNYHLGKLADRFVERSEEGYRLAEPGRRVVGAALSGGFTKAFDADPVPVEGTCLLCGADLEARFRENGVRITCIDCEFDVTDPSFPPSILEGRSPEETPRVVDRWVKRQFHAVEYGFCTYCDGRMEGRIHTADEDVASPWTDEDLGVETVALYDCQRCGYRLPVAVALVSITHPAVAGFHFEHGVDVRQARYWHLDWAEPGVTSVTNEDPLRVEVRITLDEETLVLTLDESLDHVAVRREPAETASDEESER